MARLSQCLLISTSILALSVSASWAEAPTDPATNIIEPPAVIAAKLKASGDLRAAAAMYNQALINDPTSTDIAVELSSLYRRMGQAEKALGVIKTAQKHAPDNPRVLEQLGYALIDLNETRAAVSIFDQLMAIKSNHAAAYNGKAVAFDRAGNHIAAKNMYRHALDLEPGTVRIENNLAMSMMLGGDAHEALAILKPLYEREPNNPTIRHNLAMAYGLTGNMDKALELNLIDLPPQAAQENIRYYKEHAAKLAASKKRLVTKIATPPKTIHKVKAIEPVKKAALKKPAAVKVVAVEKAPEASKLKEPKKELPKVVLDEPVKRSTHHTVKTETLEKMSPASGVDKSVIKEPKPQKPKHNAPSYPIKHGSWTPDLFRK